MVHCDREEASQLCAHGPQVEEFERLAEQSTATLAAAQRGAELADTKPGTQLQQLLDEVCM